MRRVILGVAGCVLGLSLAGTAQAHDYGPAYHGHAHGVHFRGGYYYPRHDHPHWAGRVWDTHSRRYHYFDPYRRVYYYWDPVRVIWVPVGCPEAALPVAPYPG